jgi:hypothetical protein
VKQIELPALTSSFTFYDLYFIGHKKIFVYILYLVATDQNYCEGVTALDKFKFLVCDKNNCTQGILNLISLEYCMLSYHDSLQHAVFFSGEKFNGFVQGH